MLEVKNLNINAPVAKKERERFINDLNINNEYNYAILISLNGGFSEACEESKIFSTTNDKLYCFIGNLAKKDLPDIFLKNVLLALDIAMEKIGAQGSDKQELIKLLETAVKNVKKNVDSAANLKNQAKSLSDASLKFFNDINSEQEELFEKFLQLKSDKSFSEVSRNGEENDQPNPKKIKH
ncbi:uncharacterized protein LOC124818459 [Hydra vulgaris]|uniref:uncharacterized protein LOC124818459 n=1 Tax=Hydra vulgaris TaxID=6087 RepID=UPI001F5F7AAA|nr:uncharacterized protein LOC124818459 [Hydra vulgaris]